MFETAHRYLQFFVTNIGNQSVNDGVKGYSNSTIATHSITNSFHRHHLLTNHMPGLLEAEPLIFNCLYGTDHIRVLNDHDNESTDLPTTPDLNKKISNDSVGQQQQKV